MMAYSEKGITESGKPVKKSRGISFVKYENGKAIFELGPGSYVIVAGN
jgi:alpha-L-rhamnosidase